ncbi:MAG: leucyl aminopeptidase [Prochlorotrichaceae cyanobacterium]|jgi:leucyl aminopeptidase
MNFSAVVATAPAWTGQALALGVFESDQLLQTTLAPFNDRYGETLADLVQDTQFQGKTNTVASVRVGRTTPVQHLILVGLGKPEQLSLDTLRLAAATAAKQAQKRRCTQLGLSIPQESIEPLEAIQAMVEGITLGTYRDDRFRSEVDESLTTLEDVFILQDQIDPEQAAASITKALQLCSGVQLARQLVAAPPNVVTPPAMADMAQTLAAEHGLSLEILEQEACEALKMGSFLAVAKASDLPPKFIHLTYQPAGTPRRKVALVGKGLTFDSGGLNIKVAGGSMEMMKTDMGGAAAVFGAAKAIAQIKPDVEVHFISAVTENMISGRALRPGDIITASNGKTIEVNNTDAEGRLTLADALVFAEGLGVDAIVDLATLTGACVVALGDSIAGLWSQQPDLAQGLLQASERSGDPLWQMPFEESYFEVMKSPVADMKNTGNRAGGSITAALFLNQFVKETSWAHIDIAGPVWTDKERGYHPVGATGYGVRLLVNWILSLA